MSEVYSGSSEGFQHLVDGYQGYAKEIILRRSFTDIRDGLKPVGRRCVYGASQVSNKGFIKCSTLVGKIMEYHPHGDTSIYEAMALMTDKNGSSNYPLFEGNGNLGHYYSSAGPAAMRYPKAKLSDSADDYMRDMVACEFKPSEEGEGLEPVVYPVRFPAALVMGASGLAVAVSTVVPSFNFHDVLDLAIEYLETGKMTKLLVPDFPSGGILVKDDSEIAKIMQTGRGKLKIRSKVEISGKNILVKEIPAGCTIESIIRKIDKAEIDGISKAVDSVGHTTDTLIKISCKAKKYVENVLMQLYQKRILQSSISACMIFTEDDKPVITGAYGVIKHWTSWREKVVAKKYTLMLEGIQGELKTLSFFFQLLDNPEWRDTYVDRVIHGSTKDGKAYLMEIMPEIGTTELNWIADRKLSVFNNGGSYKKRYESLLADKEEYTHILNNIDEYILKDLQELKIEKKGMYKRRTEATYVDYKFSKITVEEAEDDSFCTYTLYNTGFLFKTRSAEDAPKGDIAFQIDAKANSTLIGFDCYGRLLRVFGTDIEFTASNGTGEYMPRYFGAEEFDGEYTIKYLGLLDGKRRMLLYKDGYVGFLDTEEFINKRKTRAILNGVDMRVGDLLLDVIEEDDYPEYLLVADVSTGKQRLGIAHVGSINVASRHSRRKVFEGTNINISYFLGLSYMEVLQSVQDVDFFMDRVRPIGSKEIYKELEFKEGKYAE